MIKMICLDLDGTLLNSNQVISKTNMDSIKTALDKGIQVFFVSGRPYCFVKYWALKTDSRVQVIASNGGTYELDGKIISSNIHEETLKEIIRIVSKSNSHSYFKGVRNFYTTEAYDKRFLYSHMNDFPKDIAVSSFTDLSWSKVLTTAKEINKVLIWTTSNDELVKIRSQMEKLNKLSITSSNSISIDINTEHVSKGNTILKMLEHYGLDSTQVMSIGDSENDVSMFEVSGLKIAMGNATKSFHLLSDFITKSNDEDGVAYAISQYI